jgi:hypothetical protein
VDAILFQEWWTTGEADGWLAAGIEESIDRSLAGWQGAAVLAEWGYERNPDFELRMPGHRYCDEDHTRRGAWRGVFRGLGVIHGFENSWGPWEQLGADQPGLQHLLHLRRFVTEIVPFHSLSPAPELVVDAGVETGRRPQALANEDRSVVVAYLPVGGEVALKIGPGRVSQWFDPRTGAIGYAEGLVESDGTRFDAPTGGGADRPTDWVLVTRDAD